MNKKTKLRLSALGAILAVGLTVAGGANIANAADPSGFKDLSGAGSDTTQDVVRALAAVSTSPSIGSYDAAGTGLSAKITTKSGGPSFDRPVGSGNGVKALSASIKGSPSVFNGTVIAGQLDFARSSSGPKTQTTSVLTWIPFAKDVVSYAVNSSSDFPRDIKLGTASDSISAFTLRNIYLCNVTTYVDSTKKSVPITPILPQAGSGTRSYFLQQLGISTDGTGAGACVKDKIGTENIIENDGTVLTGAGDIVPFSAGQFISQANSAVTASPDRRGFAELGKINGLRPLTLTSTGVQATSNAAYPMARNVYNVVATSRLGDAAIASTFVGTGSTFCANDAIIRTYGFAPIGSACGSVATTGDYQ